MIISTKINKLQRNILKTMALLKNKSLVFFCFIKRGVNYNTNYWNELCNSSQLRTLFICQEGEIS